MILTVTLCANLIDIVVKNISSFVIVAEHFRYPEVAMCLLVVYRIVCLPAEDRHCIPESLLSANYVYFLFCLPTLQISLCSRKIAWDFLLICTLFHKISLLNKVKNPLACSV